VFRTSSYMQQVLPAPPWGRQGLTEILRPRRLLYAHSIAAYGGWLTHSPPCDRYCAGSWHNGLPDCSTPPPVRDPRLDQALPHFWKPRNLIFFFVRFLCNVWDFLL